MSGRELEIEIAKRLGWRYPCENHLLSTIEPSGARWAFVHVPEYLTDRNAAAEIVAWFAKHSLQGIKEFEQMVQCEQIPEVASVLANNYPVFCGLLATPRQIAEAACKVWGLEVEE